MINKTLDLAVLKPPIIQLDYAIKLAKKYNVKTICVPPCYAGYCVREGIRTCAVIDFPHGLSKANQKTDACMAMVEEGVHELDVVINYSKYLAGRVWVVQDELERIMRHVPRRIVVKAILESCYYDQEQLAEVSRLCAEMGLDFIKTSTGFGAYGVTRDAVRTMVKAVYGSKTEVKASGGIKNYRDALGYLYLGCTRLGSSNVFHRTKQ